LNGRDKPVIAGAGTDELSFISCCETLKKMRWSGLGERFGLYMYLKEINASCGKHYIIGC
jgi:hypothetical protein